MLMRLTAWALLVLVIGCADEFEPATEVLFKGQHGLLSGFAHDTGYRPSGGATQVRVKVRTAGLIKAEAMGQAASSDGPLKGMPGTGKLAVDGEVTLELRLRIKAGGSTFEGPLKSAKPLRVAVKAEVPFDPFLLGNSKVMTVKVPWGKVATIPMEGQVQGAKGNVVLQAGGTINVELRGVCARAAGGIAGFSASTVTGGQLSISAGGQIFVQGSPSHLPATVMKVTLPQTKAMMDLGSRPVKTGVAPGKGPCAVTVDAGVDAPPGEAGADGSMDQAAPDAGSCGATGGGQGTLCKKASDCKCPGTCLKIFKTAPGSCWTACDPTKTDPTTGKNPACKSAGYGEVCHGGCLPLGPVSGAFEVPVYTHPNGPTKVAELGTASVKMGSVTFGSGWGTTMEASSSFSHTLVLYGSTGGTVDQDRVLQILFPRTSKYASNQTYKLAQGKQIEVRYLEITTSGGKITRRRLRGFSWDGTLNLYAAGDGNKAPAKGGLTGRLASYETELCGAFSTPCK